MRGQTQRQFVSRFYNNQCGNVARYRRYRRDRRDIQARKVLTIIQAVHPLCLQPPVSTGPGPCRLDVFVKIIKIFSLGTVLWSSGMGPFYCPHPGKNYRNCRADSADKKRTWQTKLVELMNMRVSRDAATTAQPPTLTLPEQPPRPLDKIIPCDYHLLCREQEGGGTSRPAILHNL